MTIEPLKQTLPTDLNAAHQTILKLQESLQKKDQALEKKDQVIEKKDQTIQKKETHIHLLEERIKLMLANRYGRSSEKYQTEGGVQEQLFDESELFIEDEKPEETETVTVPAHQRKINRGKRKPLPDYLPTVRVEHELSAEELIGPHGEQFEKIGEIITKQLDIIPAQVQVIEHVCFKYAVKGKEELGIRVAKTPKQIIPKSIATPGLLSHIATAKYCHHLPLYRQSQIWESLDVDLPRNTLCRWMMKAGEQVKPLIDYLMEEIKSHRHIHVDETPVTILERKKDPPDKIGPTMNHDLGKKRHQGYMWIYTNHRGAVFDYQSSRGGEHPRAMLSEFKGYLQSDAYSAYSQFERSEEIQLVGCFSHARRKFTDVVKASGKKKKTPVADRAIDLIKKLYHLETLAQNKSLDETAIYELRQTRAKPILDRLFEHLMKVKPKTPPQSLLGKAIAYTLNHWEVLCRYVEDGTLNIDNNPAERKIKPFVTGRKNWLFCGNVKGAKAAANLYSLIESAKLYHLKVFDYLKYVFEHLPNADTPRKLEQLLPQYAKEYVPKMKDAP